MPSDYAVHLSASVQITPPRITLSWPASSQATGYLLYRKSRDASTWGTGTSLPGTATNYIDSNVSVGGSYEYRVSKTARNSSAEYTGEGYIYAGISVPLVEARGKVILVVDNSQATALKMELARLEQDLIGDGWRVTRREVSRTASVPSVKALIKADYDADPANVRAVFLLGHIPVPYSGNMSPDGHADHTGAWGADSFYGEMNGTWTDTAINTTSARDPRNRNVPGDGKFDLSLLPSDVELQVGRVDFANLPAFSQRETELLRQYLDKDHHFRHKRQVPDSRALVDDRLGVFGGEAFAVNGWRNFPPLVGSTNVIAGSWFGPHSGTGFLLGFACGGGTFKSAVGVGSTAQLATNELQTAFSFLFGSYFGDWDSEDNFLRSHLAAPGVSLTSAWAGRPHWHVHPMGLGETIGFCARLTQNNLNTYAPNFGPRGVHVALMGDPTLRLRPVGPPSALGVAPNGAGGVRLSWAPSPEPVTGYHVYKSSTKAGPFTRLTSSPVVSNQFNEASAGGSSVYMVRALKLESAPSGTYFNLSQGVFQSLDPTLFDPTIFLNNPTNVAPLFQPAAVRLVASVYDPAAAIARLEFFADNAKIGERLAPPFSLVWSNVPPGTYALSLSATTSAGRVITNSAGANSVIPFMVPAVPVTLSGRVTYFDGGQSVPGVVVNLSGDKTGSLTTGADGRFSFTTPQIGSFTLSLSKPSDAPLNRGSSEGDFTALRSHILGLATLGSPFQILAADVNESHSLSVLDLVLMRRVKLGLPNPFPAGLWKFIASDAVVQDPHAPWNLAGSRVVLNPISGQSGLDFIGIKLGDVDVSWTPP